MLESHCADLGRDPATIARSANALLVIGSDPAWVAVRKERPYGRATIIGTPSEVIDIVGRYADVGIGELILPDFTMPDPARKRQAMDLFINEVAPHFA